MYLAPADALERAADGDHGVLATINSTGAPDLVPACFAIVGEHLAIPVDQVKPKGSTALGRTRNLERDPRATLLVEHWDAGDWSRLWWVRLTLVRSEVDAASARTLEAALRDRYPQYATAPFVELLTFRVERVVGWAAAAEAEGSPRVG